jgi:hypothetical protein
MKTTKELVRYAHGQRLGRYRIDLDVYARMSVPAVVPGTDRPIRLATAGDVMTPGQIRLARIHPDTTVYLDD